MMASTHPKAAVGRAPSAESVARQCVALVAASPPPLVDAVDAALERVSCIPCLCFRLPRAHSRTFCRVQVAELTRDVADLTHSLAERKGEERKAGRRYNRRPPRHPRAWAGGDVGSPEETPSPKHMPYLGDYQRHIGWSSAVPPTKGALAAIQRESKQARSYVGGWAGAEMPWWCCGAARTLAHSVCARRACGRACVRACVAASVLCLSPSASVLTAAGANAPAWPLAPLATRSLCQARSEFLNSLELGQRVDVKQQGRRRLAGGVITSTNLDGTVAVWSVPPPLRPSAPPSHRRPLDRGRPCVPTACVHREGRPLPCSLGWRRGG